MGLFLDYIHINNRYLLHIYLNMTPIIITLSHLIPSQLGRKNCGMDLGTEVRFVVSKGKALFILHVMIGMLSSHLMQSEIIIYGLVRKCVKLSPFS